MTEEDMRSQPLTSTFAHTKEQTGAHTHIYHTHGYTTYTHPKRKRGIIKTSLSLIRPVQS